MQTGGGAVDPASAIEGGSIDPSSLRAFGGASASAGVLFVAASGLRLSQRCNSIPD